MSEIITTGMTCQLQTLSSGHYELQNMMQKAQLLAKYRHHAGEEVKGQGGVKVKGQGRS